MRGGEKERKNERKKEKEKERRHWKNYCVCNLDALPSASSSLLSVFSLLCTVLFINRKLSSFSLSLSTSLSLPLSLSLSLSLSLPLSRSLVLSPSVCLSLCPPSQWNQTPV